MKQSWKAEYSCRRISQDTCHYSSRPSCQRGVCRCGIR